MAGFTGNEYFEVSISFSSKNYEKLTEQLYLFGIENIIEEEGALKVYFPAKDSGEIDELKSRLVSSKVIKPGDFTSEKFENRNWNSEWENSIEPVFIKDKIIVYPSWKKKEVEKYADRILIEIDPKMSFGTGHNETTQIMLELMSDFIAGDEEKLLDFGTGTGVLTIAGLKLGVRSAVAIDIDDDAIENAAEYFRRNKVHDRVKLLKSHIKDLEKEEYDIVCANIIRSVIVENFSHIAERLRQKGKLFLSGILHDEDQIILELLFNHDFDVEDIVRKSDWMGVYALKRF